MKYHYLIDYENVHEEGLTGLNTIEDDAVIHIFYSDRARKLDLDSFREGQILQIEALKVPVGKQSLDMQLVSYMGYLMGRERGEGNKYIIISKDNGYLNSIPFWSQIMRDGTTVEVRPQIRPTAVEIPSQKQKKQPTAQKTEKQVFPKKYEKQTISLKSEKPASAQKKEKPEAEQPEENLTTVEEALQTAPQMTEKNERRTKGKGRSRSRREKNQESNSSRFTDRVTAAAAAVKNILIDTPNADEAKPQTEDVTSQVQTNAAAESQLQIEPDAESLTQTAEAAAPSQLPIEPASESLTQMAEASAPSQLPIEPASESLTQATEAAAPSQLPTEPASESLTQATEAAAPSQLPTEPASESLTQATEAAAPSQLPIEPASESLTQTSETDAEPLTPAADPTAEHPAPAAESPAEHPALTADPITEDLPRTAEPMAQATEPASELPARAEIPGDPSHAAQPEEASEQPVETPTAPKERKKPSVSRKPRTPRQPRTPKKPTDRSALNTAVMQTLSKSNVDAATTGKISSIVMKYASEEQSKTRVYREIIRTLGQKEGLKVYNSIKSLL